MTPSDLLLRLRPLLAAEAAAEAHGTAVEAADLEQGVWLRLLEHRRETGPMPERAAAEWLRAAVRSEGRGARLRARREVPYAPVDGGEPAAAGRARSAGPSGVEERVLAAEERRELWSAVRRLPGRCPGLLAAMLSPATRPTGKSQARWESHREVLGRFVPGAWDVCAECSRRRLRLPDFGEGSVSRPEPWTRRIRLPLRSGHPARAPHPRPRPGDSKGEACAYGHERDHLCGGR